MRPHDGEIAARDANRSFLKQEINKIDGSHRGENRTPTLGGAIATVVRGVQLTFYRWRKEFGGLNGNQVKRLKDLEKENERLRKAVSDLTLEKLILRVAASGNF